VLARRHPRRVFSIGGVDRVRFSVLSEVAAVGQGGLQIIEPGTSRSLKTLLGSWSDMALACLLHVGM